jgi:nucleotide-binding universal stress UspA family protein
MYTRILLAYDGTESGQQALLNCRDLAQWSRAELFLVAVMPAATAYVPVEGGYYEGAPTERDEEERRKYDGILADGLRQLEDAGHKASGEVLVGDAVDEITRHARQINADLIIVGHRHLDSWAARWWRGSTARALIEHAHCSVLVVITR